MVGAKWFYRINSIPSASPDLIIWLIQEIIRVTIGYNRLPSNGNYYQTCYCCCSAYRQPSLVCNNAYCLGDPVSILTGIPSGGVFSGTGISGNTFNPNFLDAANIYPIYHRPYYGCPADTATLSTIVYDLPSVSINSSGGAILCSGDTLILTANSNANNFLWSNGSTQTILK